MKTLGSLVHEETHHFHARLALLQVLLAPLPLFVGNRVRAAGLRWVGCDVGAGTVFWGLPVLTGGAGFAQRLHIGAQCWFNAGCRFDLSDHIMIHDRVALGHEVLVLTSSHALGPATRRAGPLYTRPVTIGAGAWLGARCTILPGVTIGIGAVIAAGAVVTSNVPPHTMVGGVPAKCIKTLPVAS